MIPIAPTLTESIADGNRKGWAPVNEADALIAFDRTQSTVSGDVAGTLRSNSARSEGVNDGKADNQCIAIQHSIIGRKPEAGAQGKGWRDDGAMWTLDSRADADAIAGQFGVRRLLPTECEILQGFPRNWTAVNGMSDSARYRMLGNAVAVPVAEWIGYQIMAAGTFARY